MPYKDVNGVRLYYEVYGEGEPIALLNGSLMSVESWAFQTSALSKKYKVILHEYRGQWRSDKPKEGYTFEQHAEDLKKLLEHLGVEKVNLIGISYGAAVAVVFVAKYSELTRSLVIISLPKPGPRLKPLADKWLSAYETKSPEKLIEGIIRDLFSEEYLEKNLEMMRNALVEAFRTFDFQGTFPLFAYGGRFVKGEVPIEHYFKDIRAPTLVIAGEKDALDAVEMAQILKREMPTSEVHIMPGVGHSPIFEKSREVNALILSFLEKVTKVTA